MRPASPAIACVVMVAFTLAGCTLPPPPRDSQSSQPPCIANATYKDGGFYSSCRTGLTVNGQSMGAATFTYSKISTTMGTCDSYEGKGALDQGGDVRISLDEGMTKVEFLTDKGSFSLRPAAPGSIEKLWVESRLPDGNTVGKMVSCPGFDAKLAELMRQSSSIEECRGQKKDPDSMVQSIQASCDELNVYTRDLPISAELSDPANVGKVAAANVIKEELPAIAMANGGTNQGLGAAIAAGILLIMTIVAIATAPKCQSAYRCSGPTPGQGNMCGWNFTC